MRYAKLLPMIAFVLTAACMNDTSTGPDEASLNARITTTEECVKEPGPDNTIEEVGTNPQGKLPPGQQDESTVTNGENNCQKSKN